MMWLALCIFRSDLPACSSPFFPPPFEHVPGLYRILNSWAFINDHFVYHKQIPPATSHTAATVHHIHIIFTARMLLFCVVLLACAALRRGKQGAFRRRWPCSGSLTISSIFPIQIQLATNDRLAVPLPTGQVFHQPFRPSPSLSSKISSGEESQQRERKPYMYIPRFVNYAHAIMAMAKQQGDVIVNGRMAGCCLKI
ncbi:hypothetical protein F5J12DRAFT_269819 [Pisolithus orientalis]|uniref:uncharacterized protein n=1 Tax=Pisolithus orientalis TaxID=936130 RepID=UPI0022255CD4|nr:uncharacterized protein F5J12DRAFT_269819 [Pisolithus orientalis]KAI5999838.1 hypothetical protein F5J12DRAFT_269819 [Pisolithus orientalis]